MRSIYNVLRRPLITEKSSYQSSVLNQVVFEVDSQATKFEIKRAVEQLFEVNVERVNVMNLPAKRARKGRGRKLVTRRSSYKKAIVTLAPGETIDVFEGVQ